jgi:Protein of unknown function (DUF998)
VAATQLLILIGSVGLLTCFVCLIALHILPTGFNPIHDPVSNYAVSSHGYLYSIQAFASGISGICLWVLLAKSGFSLPIAGTVALFFYAIARLLIIFSPTDVEPPRTTKGIIHALLAVLTFTGIACVAGFLTPPLTSLADWSKVGPGLRAAALLTDVAAIGFLVVCVVRPLRALSGLVERFIYIGTLLWLGIVYWQLFLSL